MKRQELRRGLRRRPTSPTQSAPAINSLWRALALAYYHLNKAEIDGYLDEERALCLELAKQKPQKA